MKQPVQAEAGQKDRLFVGPLFVAMRQDDRERGRLYDLAKRLRDCVVQSLNDWSVDDLPLLYP